MSTILNEKIKLFDYQQKLLDTSKRSYMYITDTGTGKTILALHHFKKHKGSIKKLLIIAPKNKVLEKGWEREIKNVFKEIDFEYTVMSYAMYSNMLKKIELEIGKKYHTRAKHYAPLMDTFIIFDEGHYLKNRTSKVTKRTKKLLKYTINPFLILTATPTPNGYKDYGSYLEYFGLVKTAKQYEDTYALYDARLHSYGIPAIVGWRNTKVIDTLYNTISSMPLKKEDCLELPPLIETELHFSKSKYYKIVLGVFEKIPKLRVFDTELDDKIQEELEKKSNVAIEKIKIDISKKMSKSKDTLETVFYERLADSLTSRNKLMSMLREYSNPLEKLDYLREFLENTTSNTIIFYNFNGEYHLITEMIENLENKKTVYTINGFKYDKPDNEFIPKQNVVTLVNIQSGSSGLELQYSTSVVYFTPTWSYQDYEQSLGRAYRHGQNNKVTVYNYLVEDSFEMEVANLLQSKQEFNLGKIIERKYLMEKRK